MSNRYVWNRYNISYTDKNVRSIPVSDGYSGAAMVDLSDAGSYDYSSAKYFVMAPTYNFSNGKYTLQSGQVGDGRTVALSRVSLSASWTTITDAAREYYVQKNSSDEDQYNFSFWVGIGETSNQTAFERIIHFNFGADAKWGSATAALKSARVKTNSNGTLEVWFEGGTNTLSATCYGRYVEITKGSANGTVSNSGASTYPPNDTQPRIASICVIPAILRRCKYVE